MSAAARRDVRDALTQNWDPYDVWGSAMIAAFAVCDLMTLAGLDVPAEMDYSPALGLTWPDEDENDTLRDLMTVWADHNLNHAAAGNAALTYWARVLSRYLDLPAVQAASY